MQRELVDALPLVRGLLAPDEYAAVVGRGGEDGAVFGMRPGKGPDGAFVARVLCISVVFGWEGASGRYPFSVSVRRCWSPSISKILMVLSEEQVARRRP